jgi:tetratricopeptide (TPR) repeat protein
VLRKTWGRWPVVIVSVLAALSVASCAGNNKKPSMAYEERPVELLYSVGSERLDAGQWNEAVDYFREVERQHPYSEWSRRAILMTAYAHYQGNQYEEAIKQYSKVISIKSDYVDAYYNMGNAFQKINAIEDALSSYEATLKFNHSNPRIFYALSNLYLAKKIFDKGWDFFESRWAVPELNQKGIGSNKPPFLDTTIQNKNILLWSEQGVGDQVIYLTMLKSVLQTNNEFIVSIDPRLISIYKRYFDNVTFV